MSLVSRNRIGLIQGRLSPILNNKIQSFPFENWENEFYLAKDIGLDSIEWVVDSINWENNPLITDMGKKMILETIQGSGLPVISLDPLYLTERGLLSNEDKIKKERLNFIRQIIPNCKYVGMEYILMPIVIGPSKVLTNHLKSKENRPHLIEFLKETCNICNDNGMFIAFETALNAKEIFDLMEDIGDDSIRVCYDTGNSAFFNHDILGDINALFELLVEVHIKDHKNYDDKGNKIDYYNSVKLGTGDVDFPKILGLLSDLGFLGTYILQMARGNDHNKTVVNSFNFLKNLLNK